MSGAILKEIFHRCSETHEEDFEHLHNVDFRGRKKRQSFHYVDNH